MSAALPEDDFARRAAALRDRVAAAPPQSWRPDEGHPNPIVGELVRIDDASTAYQPRVKIAVLDTPEGEWGIWLLHDVLRDEFQRQRPQSRRARRRLLRWQGRQGLCSLPRRGRPQRFGRLERAYGPRRPAGFSAALRRRRT